MDRDDLRPDPAQPKQTPPRHLDLAWSSPTPPWRADALLAAPDGATVPATWRAEPWPRVAPAPDPDPDPDPTAQASAADPADPRRHLDLAWSSPGESWTAPEPASAPQEPAVPASVWTEPWPRIVPTAAPDLELQAPVSAEPTPPEGYYADTEFDDLLELDELSFPKQRFARSTSFLAMALLLVLAFGGGILTQKHHDGGLVDPAAAAMAQLKEAAAGGGASGPALTGTITAASPTQITVRDAQGTEHKVAVTDQTPIVKKVTAQNLSTGSQVVVQGTNDADGTMHATAVVAP
ncbi:MAG TPA: DUF5666 domain-containing protein [Sporichthyaceae bacterium]|jgi:hypothetical protein|nr:DUF5666 domain-containing protein [Sporichthyaceae bacterium]